MSSLTLNFSQDIHSHFDIYGGDGVVAHVRGLVTSRANKGRTQFLDVLDVTGSIQVLLLRENFSEEDYELKCRTLRKGDIVSVTGNLELSRGKGILSIVPTVPPKRIEISATDAVEHDDAAYLATGSRIVHARIISRLESSLRERGFLEIEPKLLSAEWNGNGLEPLRAEFPGFGHNVFLVPSPLPQLFEAIISTGHSSIFSTAKCLTTSYRDVHSSSEAVSVFTVQRVEHPVQSDAEIYRAAFQCLTELFSATGTALPKVTETFEKNDIEVLEGDWSDFDVQSAPLSVHVVKNPEIPVRLSTEAQSTLADTLIEKYARVVLSHENQTYNLAECTSETRFGALHVITSTIYTEQLLSLLSTAPFRSLRTSTFWNE